ncbi:MAG: CotH kinase family protein [Bacteroidales bacterium]|nr:CotH kinase family protein [Bacteroidales bacterium]
MNKVLKINIICLIFAWIPMFEGLSQVLINEILATNANSVLDPDFYNYPDIIEIYNSGNQSVVLSDYYLSDDPGFLFKWKMPVVTLYSKQFYVFYCDKKNTGRHTNFGLDADGEDVYLTDKNGNRIDHIRYGKQYPDISYGRDPNETSRWYYCLKPTPGSANSITTALGQSPEVKYSLQAGVHNSAATLVLSGNSIKYTTNGADPDKNSTSYSQPIAINKTMTVKTKSFEDDFMPGGTFANTYFLNTHNFTLPVISLSFKPEYFYDNTIGIHVVGTNGTEGDCGSMANWNQHWERSAYLEFFDEEGIKKISQPIGVKVSGGCTRGRDQKSLSFYARGKYGDNDFDYPVFKQKPDIVSYKSLLLRNSGNDQDQTLLRDAFLQAVVNRSMDIDFQSYQPVIVYFNGEYRGIMNLREKVDEDYFFSNYALQSDQIDFLEGILRSDFNNCYDAIRGSANDYWDIVSYLTANNLDIEANYQHIASQIDIQEYINYMTLQTYVANRDWPGNNLKFWKKSENGKWRWIVFDLDYGFGFRLDENGYTHETFDFVTEPNGPDHPNPSWSTLLFRKLIENEGFKKQFLSTYITHMYTSFTPEWCNYVLDSLSSVIDYEIGYNQAKYGRTKDKWLQYLNDLKEYALKRNSFMPGHVKSFFNLSSDTRNISIINKDTRKGKVLINEALIQMYPAEIITYNELPLKIKAIPEKGYQFKQWNYAGSNNLLSNKVEIVCDTSYHLEIEPVFEPVVQKEGIYLNEIASTTSLFRDEFDEKSGFVELYNNTTSDIALFSYFISDKKGNLMRYAIPDSTVIPANGYITIFLDAEAKQGDMHASFKTDQDGETIFLSIKSGDAIEIIDSVNYNYIIENHSFGKYPDGTGSWQHMVNITPGSTNDAEKLMDNVEYPLAKDMVKIYPNPSDGLLRIMLTNSGPISETLFLDIADLSGKIVFPKAIINIAEGCIDLTSIPEGFYFVRIFRGDVLTETEKLLIIK